MRHALVTGAGGFVGRSLCRRLQAEGVVVRALHRRERPGPWQTQVCVDLACEPVPAGALEDIDSVFHLAGHAHAEDAGDAQAQHQATSVEGTLRLIDALHGDVRRVVYASSVKAMGESTPLGGIDESAPCRPQSAYGWSRLEAERALLAASAPTRQVTVLRLPLVYGPGVGGNLGRLMRAVRRRWMPYLPAIGNRRSMIHVDDVARAAITVATHPAAAGAVFLLSDGEGYATDEVVRAMYAALGERPQLPPVPAMLLALAARVGDGLRLAGMSSVAFDSQALAKLVASVRYHGARIRAQTGYVPENDLYHALPEMFAHLETRAR